MDIYGILKNLKDNLSLKKNNKEYIVKDLNNYEDDLLKIKLTPVDGEDVFVIDDDSSRSLDDWFFREGRVVETGSVSDDTEDGASGSSGESGTDKPGEETIGEMTTIEEDPEKTAELEIDDGWMPLEEQEDDTIQIFPTPIEEDKTVEVFQDDGWIIPDEQHGDTEELDITQEPFGFQPAGDIPQDNTKSVGFDFEDWNFDPFVPAQPTVPSTNIPYEPQLDVTTLGMYQAGFHTPDPIDTDESVLDTSIKELESMPLLSIRTLLIDEIEALKDASPEKRNAQLQKIFNRLLEFQPRTPMYSSNTHEFLTHEQRFFIDLVSTPELYETPFVREFLENNFYVSFSEYAKKKFLLKLYEYYDEHSPEAIEKVNYILRSSDNVGCIIMDNDIDLGAFFTEEAMASFDKEDLSQLFRFYFAGNDFDRKTLQTLFSEQHHKSLFMISQLTRKVKDMTGHSSEFLESALEMFNNTLGYNSFVVLLEDIYDKVVGSREEEEKFAKAFSRTDDFIVMKELINYVVMKKYDYTLSNQKIEKATTLEAFLKGAEEYRELNHRYVLGDIGLSRFKAGTFDPTQDFRPIENAKALKDFKRGMLFSIYGISLEEAEHLHKHYCRYMDALEEGIIEQDRPIFEMLKAIESIYTLDGNDPDFNDKLRVLQGAYFKQISEKGLASQKATASAVIVEGLLNRMFMNTYNHRLMQVSHKSKVLEHDGNITVIDAGLDFEMIVTSLSGVSEFYDSDVNMASKWNTAALSRGQGFCASHLTSRNLGVISLDSPILGFSQIPQDGLATMGTSDIYTNFTYYNIRRHNDSRGGSNRFFVPGNIMGHETRYGYNEILLDRFLMSDEEGELKLQPDYLVVYKLDDMYRYSIPYLQSKKMAEDFGIPIVLVDVPKIKAHEKETILKMEEELFTEEFSEQKFSDIVTRYMDNYTGSLTIIGYGNKEDFSVGEMRRFFNKVFKHIESIEDPELKERWVKALEDVYKEEYRKNDEARSVGQYKHSVKGFILDDKYNLRQRIADLDQSFDLDRTAELDPFAVTAEPTKAVPHSLPKVFYDEENYTFTTSESMSVEVKALVDFAEYMELGSKFKTVEYTFDETPGLLVHDEQSDDNEILVVENLLVSYLIGNYEEAPLSEISGNYGHNVNIDFDSDIIGSIDFSPYSSILDRQSDDYIGLPKEKIDLFVTKLEEMSEEKFLSIFSPVIATHAKRTNESFESLASKLLDRKAGAREMFETLGNKYGYIAADSQKSDDEGPKSR